ADVSMRVPSALRALEPEMRNRVAAALRRGKIDVTVSVDNLEGDAQQHFNIPEMRQYKARIEEMRDALGLPEPGDWYSLLLRFPDSMTNTSRGEEADEAECAAAMKALDTAIVALTDFRRTEGLKLESFFGERIDRIAGYLAEVPRYEGERITRIRARMEEGLSAIQGVVELDRGRLEQELFFYIEKLDINEEKQRLAQHLSYFVETMNLCGEPQGKKLGFIAQEMGREINTLGSKSNQGDMQLLVVHMKDELEQIKEQVLNAL
ncbi:MAG: DUF1732 domain-containing protein, partial [Duncaniella sp.]|nr:DUF1732 domain-containing protein [Duncaniella sp.]